MMKSIRKSFSLLFVSAVMSLVAAGVGKAAEEEAHQQVQEVDVDLLREIPVWHHGRVMPLDTLAKVAGETICGTGSKVKIQLGGYYTDKELKSPSMQGALEMFPGGEMRRVPVEEMLLMWVIEPEKWEEVAFILCENED